MSTDRTDRTDRTERLMVVRLVAQGCTAEAWFNGMPVARVNPRVPDHIVPVHEASLVGPNRMELMIEPDTEPDAPPVTAAAPMSARLQLLLPRMGAPIDDAQVRTLAEVDWTCQAGDALTLPIQRVLQPDLPVRFPRWRWLDAPVPQVTPALVQQAYTFVMGLARDLARGQTESFLAATRLRTEELALAYQRSPESESARLREWLEQLYASSALVWQPLTAEEFRLRRLAGSRLLECLGGDGRAALTTVPDKEGRRFALPLKLSVVEGRFYVLR